MDTNLAGIDLGTGPRDGMARTDRLIQRSRQLRQKARRTLIPLEVARDGQRLFVANLFATSTLRVLPRFARTLEQRLNLSLTILHGATGRTGSGLSPSNDAHWETPTT